MTDPITIDIPHQLGLEGARAKLEQGVGQIAGVIPGGSMRSHRWQGNTLHFEIEALGQRVDTKLEVFKNPNPCCRRPSAVGRAICHENQS